MENITWITIFNMNKLEVEREEKINWEEKFVEEIPPREETNLNDRGLAIIHKDEFYIKDLKKFINYIIKTTFEGYDIFDVQHEKRGIGHPDYILKKGDDYIYLELKLDSDALREGQLKWFCDNKDKNNKVMWIYTSNLYFTPESKKQLESESKFYL